MVGIPCSCDLRRLAGTDRRRSLCRQSKRNKDKPLKTGAEFQPFEMRREMRTFDARARSEGRTPAGRPDGLGTGQRRAVIAPSVQGWVLPHLIAWVESRSVDASPIRRLFGRTRLDDPNVRVPEAVTETAWRLAATLTCDDALGIHLAESLPRGALDLIEYALRSSPSLEKGLDRLARYGRLLSDRVAARTHRKGEGLLLLVHDTATHAVAPGTSRICAGSGAQAGA